MKLEYLLEKIEYECVQGTLDCDITAVEYDTRKELHEGSLFICIEGAVFDGHEFALEAAKKASVLVISKDVAGLEGTAATVIILDIQRKN